jgi:curved DNA-binding protein CbpA
MNTAKDYYAILGVLPTAEDFVIEAAYRALSKRYHPDRYGGSDAHEKMSAINEAYEVLGNASKRKEYDQERKSTNQDDSEFFNSEFDNLKEAFAVFEDDWKVAVSYYPELVSISDRLAKISSRLAFSFRVFLLQKKKYENAKSIADQLEKAFLTDFFGSSSATHEFALLLIEEGRKDILLELNQGIKVIGSGGSSKVVDRLCEKYDLLTPAEMEAKQWGHYKELVRSIESNYSVMYDRETFNLWKEGKIKKVDIQSRIKYSKNNENLTLFVLIGMPILILIAVILSEYLP